MTISVVLFALFVLALAAIGLGAVWVFSRRDAAGRLQPLGCAMGCLLGAVLGVLGLAGLGGFLMALSAHTVADGIESLPVRSVTLLSDPGEEPLPLRPFHDPQRPLHLLFEIEGSEAPIEQLVALIEERSRGDARIEVTRMPEDSGAPATSGSGDGRRARGPRTIVDVALPADRHDLRELERDLRRYVLPRLDLEQGVRVRLRTSQDW